MKKGKAPDRLFTRVICVHAKEQSWRARKKVARGQAKLTQPAYLCANRLTFNNIPQGEYPHHGGSVASDMFGPIDLDALSTLPKMSIADKKAYWGKRYVLAGGAVPSEEEDDDEAYQQEAKDKDDEYKEELKEHKEIDPDEVDDIISDAREEDNPTIHEEYNNGNGGEPEQPEAQNDPEDTNIVYNADEEKSQTTESTRRLKLETRPLKGWSQQ